MAATTVVTATNDGRIESSHASSYTTARAGSALAVQTDELRTGQLNFAGSFACYESFLDFDVSAIPASHDVLTVVLEVWPTSLDVGGSNFNFNVRGYDWGPTLTTGDWVAGANLGAAGPAVAFRSTSTMSTGAYNALAQQAGAAGVIEDAVAGAGRARMIVYSNRHLNGNQPTGAEFVRFAKRTVVGQEPRLTVTHEGELVNHAATGGVVAGGAAAIEIRATMVASGGPVVGGAATVEIDNGGWVLSGVVLEWDADNDGDFDQLEENITGAMVSAQTQTGRDWPSQLTGKAGPGKFRAKLRNDDNRFSFFNTASPLNQAPFSLASGRKLRVRTEEAADPDPVLWARDRFRRPNGPLGDTETGQTWVQPGPTFTIDNERAVATSLGNGHVAVVDVGTPDYQVQVTLGRNFAASDSDSAAGIVFRYVDADNLSLFQVRSANIGIIQTYELIDIVAGTPTVVTSFTENFYSGTTIGVIVAGSAVQLSVEGVVLTAEFDAVNPSATQVGLYALWAGARAPEIERFDAWERRTERTEGILWTGDNGDIHPTSSPGPNNTAQLDGEGWFSKLATQRVRFPGLVLGAFAEHAMGKVLADSNLLHPPGRFQGFISPRTSVIGLDEEDAIEPARMFEDHEGGFLHESQEGWIDFDGRAARDNRPVQATFSDASDAQFSYETFDLLDWRREIFNQVEVGLGHRDAHVPANLGHSSGAFAGVEFNLPGAFIDPGDLIIGIATASGSTGTDLEWLVPSGWEHLTSGKPLRTNPINDGNNFRIYAKIADGSESGIFTIATASATLAFATQVWVFRRWFGDIRQGVALGEEHTTGFLFDPVFPGWAPQAATVLAIRWGRAGTATVSGWTEQGFDGFFDGRQTLNQATAGRHVCIQAAYKAVAAEDLVKPQPFDGTFSGFSQSVTRAIAIRGFAGDPPEPSGIQRIIVDDRASQDRHNAIKTYISPPSLYQPEDEADAVDLATEIIERHGQDRPIIRISFTATKNAAYRAQAIKRRVGDKIRLIANQGTGMGINGDFFIENIGHRFDKGQTVWVVTWELSPA